MLKVDGILSAYLPQPLIFYLETDILSINMPGVTQVLSPQDLSNKSNSNYKNI